MSEIPYGFCMCGCGEKTPIAKETDRRKNIKKGEHLKFIHGHNSRLKRRGNTRIQNGYVQIRMPEHRRSFHGFVFEHIVIAEKALGKDLPSGAVVHHVAGKSDNTQLVICLDQGHHRLIHQRARALAECGNADWRRCYFCGEWDSPSNMTKYKNHVPFHRECERLANRTRAHARCAKTKD